MTTPVGDRDPDGSDPGELIGQALRAQVGAPRRPTAPAAPAPDRLTRAQVLLIAAIVGLVIGMGVGFAILLTSR